VRTHTPHSFNRSGLTHKRVSGFEEVERLLDAGNKLRITASTGMNEQSSRSHAVFTLHLIINNEESGVAGSSTAGAANANGDDDAGTETGATGTPAMDSVNSTRRAKASLVDLAGSERAKMTGCAGDRLKEASSINSSLSTLRYVCMKGIVSKLELCMVLD
jgi:hypothetical protein